MGCVSATGRRLRLEDVLAENELLRQEIRTAHEAAEISAGLVVQQFENSEALLRRLSAVLDGLPDAAFVVDHEHKVVAWNRALVAMTGYSAADMLGKGQGDYAVPFYGERRPILVDLLQMPDEEVATRYPVVRHEGDVLSGEAAIHVQGRTLYVEARASALRNAGGEIVGGIEIVRDLTERKRVADEVAAARKAAEKASQAKAEFLANMSHEIRTPMNAIVGMTHLALQTGLDARQRNYLEKVERAARGLLGIINDILDFSKIEAGKIAFEHIGFQLDEVLDGVADLAAIKAEDKDLELLFDIAADVPVGLVGDPLRLSQVLTNLVGNAIKFTERGEVTVAVSRIAAAGEGVRLRFAVSDTGVGLTEEQRGRLFSAFSQADGSTTRKYGGTGLGLSISKRLVEMMDGEIGVDSAPGAGSTFHFTARFDLHAEQRSLDVAAHHLPGLRVLVVDDNASAREIFLAMLASLRFEAAAVASGAEAVAELERAQREGNPYGLVLMDWRMPRMDGVEAIRRIRADPALVDTPTCLMVTAHSRDDLRQQVADAQVRIDGLLVKPVSPSTLCDGIMTVFGKDIGRQLRRQQREVGHREAARALRGACVLLVEDNEINRELALEILGNAGLAIDVACDGAQALEMLAGADYDGVLMDCQMPVMDGFEATRRIRADGRTLPVIAMTANAMAGDREKCLACGMNDHIAKPMDVGQLFATLARWVKPGAAATEADGEAAASPEVEVPPVAGLDLAVALSRLAGDGALLIKLLRSFRDGQAGAVAEIRAALAAGEREAALRLAHTLKGLAGNIGANGLAEAARRLERRIGDEAGEPSEDLLSETECRLAALCAEIDRALPSAPAAAAVGDAAALPSLLREMALLLADDDAAACAHADRLAALLQGGAAAEDARRLSQAIGNYAFDEALDLVRGIAASTGASLE